MHGQGVFKEASTGRVERRLYYEDELIEVLEVIQEGNKINDSEEVQSLESSSIT
jgi:hypothetical protein